MTVLDHTEQSGAGDPLAGKPRPPGGLLPRLAFYGRRSGYVYAALSFIGRSSFPFWCAVAPWFSHSKIAAWLQQPGPRILNLGGGGNTFDRWLTADVDPRADVFVDITQALLFPDNTVDVIYLEEVIEHISLNEGEHLLSECYRVLKPSGTIRLTTPCLDHYCAQFDGGIAHERKINEIFYHHEHRHIYSMQGLEALLLNAGFADVRASQFRDNASPYGYFDTHALRFGISDRSTTQYWDARKNPRSS